MNYLDILIILGVIGLVISIIGLFIYQKFKRTKSTNENVGFIICMVGFAIFVIVLFSGMMIVSSYSDALSLPYQYQSACDTVNETEKLLMRYDNIENGSFNSVGYGLEAQQLKSQLKDAIKTKYELRAKILSWLNDPMAVYKDVLLERLPDNFS